MSTSDVLSAALALGEFSMDEVESFCDETEPVIAQILERFDGQIIPVETSPDRVSSWRVVDAPGLRQYIRAERARSSPGQRQPTRTAEVSTVTQLEYAEQTLLDSGEERSVDERRALLAIAKNHLRQVLSRTTSSDRPWWEFRIERLAPDHGWSQSADPATQQRVALDVEVTSLTEHSLAGHTLSAGDLVDTVKRIQPMMQVLDSPPMRTVVDRFVDLVLAQVTPAQRGEVEAPSRLLSALSRRRVKAQLERSVESALGSLVPLLVNVDREGDDASLGLFQVLDELPRGRQHVVVYSDLLGLLPEHFQWRTSAVRVPGVLTEAVADPDTSHHLEMCANRLQEDLYRSPYGSDSALIGSTVHVFRQLAEQTAGSDRTVLDRSDEMCTELLGLAQVALR